MIQISITNGDAATEKSVTVSGITDIKKLLSSRASPRRRSGGPRFCVWNVVLRWTQWGRLLPNELGMTAGKRSGVRRIKHRCLVVGREINLLEVLSLPELMSRKDTHIQSGRPFARYDHGDDDDDGGSGRANGADPERVGALPNPIVPQTPKPLKRTRLL